MVVEIQAIKANTKKKLKTKFNFDSLFMEIKFALTNKELSKSTQFRSKI